MELDRLTKSSIVGFVTDTSKENSIKQHRRKSEILLISDPKTEVPKDWNGSMKNAGNKTQLIKFLLTNERNLSIKPEQRHDLTSTDAEAVAVRSDDCSGPDLGSISLKK